jgi:predicted MFS family arabinose efflux permease
VNVKLAILALGSFVVAADGTLLVGLLRGVADDLSVSAAAAGLAVSIFGAVYALTGPPLLFLLRRASQKWLLVGSLASFAASNVATGVVTNLPGLVAARGLAAAAAALFVPTAAVTAAVTVGRELYGRALATVVSGAAAGTAIGVPAGTLIGAWAGWRVAFYLLAALAVTVALGAAALFPEGRTTSHSPASLPGRQILVILAVTGLWALGSFTFFTYLSVVLARSAGVGTPGLGLFLLLFGLSGVAGSRLAGWITDTRGARTALLIALPTVALSIAGLGLLAARGKDDTLAVAGSAAMLALYGLSTWAVMPPQQRRLLASGNDQRLLLSLNASALYTGVALGSVSGALILSLSGSPSALCLTAAAFEVAALSLLARTREITPSSLAQARRRATPTWTRW